MAKVKFSLYLPEEMVAEIKRVARERSRSVSVLTQDLYNRAISVHYGAQRAKTQNHLGPMWPSGAPKQMPCPVGMCGRYGIVHKDDWGVGHGLGPEQIRHYARLWSEAGKPMGPVARWELEEGAEVLDPPSALGEGEG